MIIITLHYFTHPLSITLIEKSPPPNLLLLLGNFCSTSTEFEKKKELRACEIFPHDNTKEIWWRVNLIFHSQMLNLIFMGVILLVFTAREEHPFSRRLWILSWMTAVCKPGCSVTRASLITFQVYKRELCQDIHRECPRSIFCAFSHDENFSECYLAWSRH